MVDHVPYYYGQYPVNLPFAQFVSGWRQATHQQWRCQIPHQCKDTRPAHRCLDPAIEICPQLENESWICSKTLGCWTRPQKSLKPHETTINVQQTSLYFPGVPLAWVFTKQRQNIFRSPAPSDQCNHWRHRYGSGDSKTWPVWSRFLGRRRSIYIYICESPWFLME